MMDQAPTSTLVLVLMISLLKPFSASATHFNKTSFNFPSFGYESLNLLHNQITFVMPPNLYLSPMQPNHDPSGDCRQATYSRDVLLWDKATGNAAGFTAQFVFGMESRNRNTSDDRLAFFVAPPGSVVSCDPGGEYQGLPKGSFVANRVDSFKNPWDGDVPHVGIDLNNIRSAANVTITWLNETMDGRLVNASITQNSKAKNLSVMLVDANGDSSNSVFTMPHSTGAAHESHMVRSWEFSSS